MAKALVTIAIRHEQDVVSTRQRAREIACLDGFDGQDQTRIATSVSRTRAILASNGVPA